MKQAILNQVRKLNKSFTNKIMIHICGKKIRLFVILSHIGRKSGKLYRIPIIAEQVDDGFVIALTYGKNVDWYYNVKAKGECSIFCRYKEYPLTTPIMLKKEKGLQSFPLFIRAALRVMRIEYFLKLDYKQA